MLKDKRKAKLGNISTPEQEKPVQQPRLKTIQKTQCGRCGRYFVGVSSFDAHRTGPQDARRCKTTEEMEAAGLQSERRLVVDHREGRQYTSEQLVWYQEANREMIRKGRPK